jgi:hypothetical protein
VGSPGSSRQRGRATLLRLSICQRACAIASANRRRSIFVRAGRFGIRRRSTLICCRRTRFSASSSARDLNSEARMARISLSRSVIRPRAYPVCSLRRCRIQFSVHTALCDGSSGSRNRENGRVLVICFALRNVHEYLDGAEGYLRFKIVIGDPKPAISIYYCHKRRIWSG